MSDCRVNRSDEEDCTYHVRYTKASFGWLPNHLLSGSQSNVLLGADGLSVLTTDGVNITSTDTACLDLDVDV